MAEQIISNIPLWLVRQLTVKGDGVRMTKMVYPYTGDPCDVCGKRVDRRFEAWGKWRCQECEDNRMVELRKRWAIEDAERAKKFRESGYFPGGNVIQLPTSKVGNLTLAEYRFWIGVQVPHSNMRICRGCKETIYSSIAAGVHKEKKVWGDPCTIRLVRLYKKMLELGLCAMCQERTNTQRWGVPLCKPSKDGSNGGKDCIRAWMYDQRGSELLQMFWTTDIREEITKTANDLAKRREAEGIDAT